MFRLNDPTSSTVDPVCCRVNSRKNPSITPTNGIMATENRRLGWNRLVCSRTKSHPRSVTPQSARRIGWRGRILPEAERTRERKLVAWRIKRIPIPHRPSKNESLMKASLWPRVNMRRGDGDGGVGSGRTSETKRRNVNARQTVDVRNETINHLRASA